MVEVEVPSAVMDVVPVIVEFTATGDPVWKRTVPPALTTGVAIEMVLVSAVVEARVHSETPVASEAGHVP